MSRNVTYAHLDVDLLSQPKFIHLLDDGGPAVFLGWTTLILWARAAADWEHLERAGRISPACARRMLRAVDLDVDVTLGLLEKHGLVERELDDTLVIHDFVEHQHLREWADRQRRNVKGGQARAAQVRAQAQPTLEIDAEPRLSTNPTHTNPNPEQPKVGSKEPTGVILTRFEDFYEAYPRKVSKPAALRAFRKAVKDGVDPQTIISGAETYAAACNSGKIERQFIPYPATWVNGHRWDDPLDETQPETSGEYAPW